MLIKMQIEDNINHQHYSIHLSVLYCNTDKETAALLEDVKSRSSIISLWHLLLCRNIWQVHLKPRHQSHHHLFLMVLWQGQTQWQPPHLTNYKDMTWHKTGEMTFLNSRFIFNEMCNNRMSRVVQGNFWSLVSTQW